jgi:4-oxalocrotonate tautomerase
MPIVTIDWLEGRDEQQKRSVAREITQSLVNITGCSADAVTIVFNDHSRSDWAKAGKLLSDS